MSIFKKNWKEDKVEDEWKQIIPPPNDIPSRWKDREYLIYGDGIKTGEITKWHNPDGKLTHYTWRRYNKEGKNLPYPRKWIWYLETKRLVRDKVFSRCTYDPWRRETITRR